MNRLTHAWPAYAWPAYVWPACALVLLQPGCDGAVAEEDGGSEETTDASTDSGAEDAGPHDAGPHDAGTDGDVGDGGRGPTEVCGPTYELPSFHPIAGMATIISMVDLEPESRVELDGPSWILAPAANGCMFHASPGHYAIRLHTGDTVQDWAEVDLLGGETSVLAIHGTDASPRALAVPIDLSAPPAGSWRAVFIDLALDNAAGLLDVHAYGPGLFSPEGTPERIVAGMSFGDVVEVEVPARSLLYEFQPKGTDPDGLYTGTIPDCGAPAVVSIQAIWCDTAELYDDPAGPCHARAGAAVVQLSVDDQPCGTL